MNSLIKLRSISRVIEEKTGIHYLDAIDEDGNHWTAQQRIDPLKSIFNELEYTKEWRLSND